LVLGKARRDNSAADTKGRNVAAREEVKSVARDETAGGDVSERIAIVRFVVLIDIVAEIYGAIAGHPTRNADPCDGYPVRP